jgi:hypothetical protein
MRDVEGHDIRIAPLPFTVESVRGSVPALGEPKSLDEIYDEAGNDYVRRVIDEMSGRQE